MIRQLRIAESLAATLALGLAVTGCGRDLVGIGNSGNRIGESDVVATALAEELGDNPAIPAITDETLGEIFGAILTNAREGDPKAALIVLRTAQEQRKAAEEGT